MDSGLSVFIVVRNYPVIAGLLKIFLVLSASIFVFRF